MISVTRLPHGSTSPDLKDTFIPKFQHTSETRDKKLLINRTESRGPRKDQAGEIPSNFCKTFLFWNGLRLTPKRISRRNFLHTLMVKKVKRGLNLVELFRENFPAIFSFIILYKIWDEYLASPSVPWEMNYVLLNGTTHMSQNRNKKFCKKYWCITPAWSLRGPILKDISELYELGWPKSKMGAYGNFCMITVLF